MFRTLISSGGCASACNTDTTPTQPCRNSNTHRTENNTTNVVIQQNSHKLLMMDTLMSESCWAHKKWNKIASDIKLVFYSSFALTIIQVLTHHLPMLSHSIKNCSSRISPSIPFTFSNTIFNNIVNSASPCLKPLSESHKEYTCSEVPDPMLKTDMNMPYFSFYIKHGTID